MSTVTSAIEHIGLTKTATRVKLYPSAVQKWRKNGRLPQTDLSGLTDYASSIAELCRETGLSITREQLLADTRAAWVRNPPRMGRPKKIRANSEMRARA